MAFSRVRQFLLDSKVSRCKLQLSCKICKKCCMWPKKALKPLRIELSFYANRGCSPREIEVGTWVYLKVRKDLKVLRTGKRRKLSPRYSIPYKVVKNINQVAYQLDLPMGLGFILFSM
ncbi:hypothetical protein O6H91_02G080300 [Diphasiastrum complanatum]|uniref:Uncharacterized protein n=1 Tax=Diphasiastrum complanatum TaxID=34168 RepID=A0ACC2EHD2_DIPCM|nr:hypothetical protein O6H91_02G080300 [Diphasiastrum complanatum]